MLVYGDHARTEATEALVEALLLRLREVERLPPGLARHAALVALLIEAGELAQGVLDALYRLAEAEVWTPTCIRLLAVPLALARAVALSHASGYREAAPVPRVRLEALRRTPLPAEVAVKRPEGYAYYAVYPEAYLEAARALPAGGPPVRVVGIRSIGTSLACTVAAVVGRGRTPLTVRPGGHPFARTLTLSAEAERRLLGRAEACRYAVVDEGPGLSGSSFGAVADLLEARGVPASRIHFFPSHEGPLGPQASERHRTRWARARRHTVSFESLFLGPEAGAHALPAWVEDLTGGGAVEVEDVGGGGWRRHLFAREAQWPAVFAQQERRKYLVRSERGTWLLKFAGLGRSGERRLAFARRLADAGFGVPVVGLRHGFLVQPWLEGARTLHPTAPVSRAELVVHLGRYLGFRARHLKAAQLGASPERLLEMARHNAAEALGVERARALEPLAALVPELRRRARPVAVDGRLQPWEWLLLPDGRLLKADAVDHHDAHDLVGCQDIAWDIAGAAVELGLTESEQEELADAVARHSGDRPPPPVLRFYTACYLAFRVGQCTLAAQSTGGSWPQEEERLRQAAARYTRLLAPTVPSLPGRGKG